jgi:hypothetical protein
MPNLKTVIGCGRSPGPSKLYLFWFRRPACEALPHTGRRYPKPWFMGGIAAAALLVTSSHCDRAAAAETLHLRCTNPASGASWPLDIDLDRGRVSSFSATITDKWISWRDPKEGFFDLDRTTGQLELRNASSTGGYFLHYKCRPE